LTKASTDSWYFDIGIRAFKLRGYLMDISHEGRNPTIKNKVYPEAQAHPGLYKLSNPG